MIKQKIKIYCYYLILKMFLFVVFLTCRWRVIGLNKLLQAISTNKPIMLCLWHEQLVFISRFFKNTKLNFYGIISTHADAEIYSKILKDWKIQLIRGSSTRGWSNVVKQMIKVFHRPSAIVAITNDGPQGPPKVAKEGSVSIAKKYNAQIVSVAAKASKFWRIKSWDQTILPKPFSTIYIQFSDPHIPCHSTTTKEITSLINNNIDNLNNLK